jgi:hypothetical protein
MYSMNLSKIAFYLTYSTSKSQDQQECNGINRMYYASYELNRLNHKEKSKKLQYLVETLKALDSIYAFIF